VDEGAKNRILIFVEKLHTNGNPIIEIKKGETADFFYKPAVSP
jgi:hypothetical protein